VPSKDPAQRFEDILYRASQLIAPQTVKTPCLENIVLIEEFTAGMDLTAFTEDLKTSNAVERCLERIGEAARKLGGSAEELCPAIPWPQLRAVGNFLRHEYDRIDIVRVWLTIEDDLAQ
jgi:uncharacterized protein with HEPN domain